MIILILTIRRQFNAGEQETDSVAANNSEINEKEFDSRLTRPIRRGRKKVRAAAASE